MPVSTSYASAILCCGRRTPKGREGGLVGDKAVMLLCRCCMMSEVLAECLLALPPFF